MAKDLQTFFEMYAKPSNRGVSRDSYELRYAAAALMIACSRADFEEDPDEEEVIIEILRNTFNVSENTLDSLIRLADAAASHKGLDEFTQQVNHHYNEKGKFLLIENLWRVAYADGRIDRYEEVFIRRIAAKIHILPADIKKAQDIARTAAENASGAAGQ